MAIAVNRTAPNKLKYFSKARDFTAELHGTMFATPADFSRASSAPSSWAAAPASACDTILIVEDEDPIAALLTCILERGGFHVRRARDGAECLRLFRAHASQIALAILDGTLPDLNGGVLSRMLRERSTGLPLLFVSGRDLTALRAALAAGGPTGFLAKPFTPRDVLREVRRLIGAGVRSGFCHYLSSERASD